jgi:hypothetical protein
LAAGGPVRKEGTCVTPAGEHKQQLLPASANIAGRTPHLHTLSVGEAVPSGWQQGSVHGGCSSKKHKAHLDHRTHSCMLPNRLVASLGPTRV